ncbi:hypothetical protein V5799_033674 [Amblyomma americanum]|uniref:Peptidase M13 N-terminal domain-containing protein n=1 Tax=Amblyomma americanum TaxID=6943 RepID=A0AAQ4DMN1_AMBAM
MVNNGEAEHRAEGDAAAPKGGGGKAEEADAAEDDKAPANEALSPDGIPVPALPMVLSLLGMSALPVLYCLSSVLFAFLVEPYDSACNSEVCFTAGDYLKRSVDERVKPCVNFYDFVCSGWDQEYINDASSSLTLVNLSVYLPGESNNPPNIVKAKSFYKSCESSFKEQMDTSIDDLKAFIKNDLRFDWPNVLPNITIDELYRIVVELQLSYFVHPFFIMTFDSGMVTLSVSTGERYHPWYLHYANTAQSSFRLQLINDVLNAVFPQALPVATASNITTLEDKLSAIRISEDELLVVRMKVLSQNPFVKGWPLLHAIGNFLDSAQKRLLSRKVTIRVGDFAALSETLIMISDPKYVQAVASYVVWVIVETLGRRTSPALRKIMKDTSVRLKTTNVTDHVFRGDVCYHETYRLFALLLDRHMYEKFDKTTLVRYENVVDTVKLFMRAQLEDLFWMDEATVRSMQKRIREVISEVGILSRFRYRDVEEPYNRLPDIDSTMPFTTLYVSVSATLNQFVREKAYRYVYPSEVWSSVPTVRYVYPHNLLFVPLSILMPPLFARDNFPTALSYGRIVTQIAYAIYYEGYYSNKYRGAETWNLPTERKFNSYMDCYNKAFNNVTYEMWDPAESFFRSGALLKAFQMFKIARVPSGDFVLPSISLTPIQLFFVGSCLDQCTRNDEERLRRKALCNWPMRRTKIFQEAFHCSPTDPLGHLPVKCSGLASAISGQYQNVSIGTSFRCSGAASTAVFVVYPLVCSVIVRVL